MTFAADLGADGARADAALAAAVASVAALDAQIVALDDEIAAVQALIDAETGGGSPPPPPVGSTLRYAPPTLTSPTTITVTPATRKITLGENQDAIINLGRLIDVPGGVEIRGGRKIRIIGGEIGFTKSCVNSTFTTLSSANRCIFLKGSSLASNARREVHIEGVLFSGSHIAEVINGDCSGRPTTVTLQNLRVVGHVIGAEGANHSNVVQFWNGPEKLRIDGLEADHVYYQGIYMEQLLFGGARPLDSPAIEMYRTHIVQETDAAQAFYWTAGGVIGSDNWVRNDAYWAAQASKGGIPQGTWPFTGYTGSPRPATILNSGVDYVSPGYL